MARNWSAEKIARVEAQAERLGALQVRVMGSRWFAFAVVLVAVAVAGLLIGGLEHSL
jgi:hypothetical protein